MSINFLRLLEQRMESSMKERQEMVDLESYRSSDSFWFVIIYRMILTLLEWKDVSMRARKTGWFF